MAEWRTETVESCLTGLPLTGRKKVQTQDYRPSGRYPIIDQGQGLIAGWTDDDSGLVAQHLPVVVFGDHTRALKFVDFPFVRGADGTQILKPKHGIDPLFFYYALKAIDLPSRGYNRHFKVLKEKEVQLPEEGEQAGIARLLKLTEDALALQDSQLRKWGDLKPVTMRTLFARGLRGEAQKETEVGLVPDSWLISSLGDYCSVRNGFAFESKDYAQSGIVNFRVVNIQWDGSVNLFEDVKFLPLQFCDAYRDYLLEALDILLVMVGATRGKICQITQEHLPALMNQNMWRINSINDSLDQRFLYHQLSELVPKFMEKYSEGQRGFFKKEELRAEPLKVPSLSEQREIASILDAIDRKIDLHRRKRAVLSELFKALLRQLMTGEIRIADLDLSSLSFEIEAADLAGKSRLVKEAAA